jgi:hypothetical protein
VLEVEVGVLEARALRLAGAVDALAEIASYCSMPRSRSSTAITTWSMPSNMATSCAVASVGAW